MKANTYIRRTVTGIERSARDKMILDIIFGKQPHFLGVKIKLPNAPRR